MATSVSCCFISELKREKAVHIHFLIDTEGRPTRPYFCWKDIRSRQKSSACSSFARSLSVLTSVGFDIYLYIYIYIKICIHVKECCTILPFKVYRAFLFYVEKAVEEWTFCSTADTKRKISKISF